MKGFPSFRISIKLQTASHRCRRYAEGKWRKRRAIQTAMRVENFFPKVFEKPKFHVQMISNVTEMTKGYKQKAVRDQKTG